MAAQNTQVLDYSGNDVKVNSLQVGATVIGQTATVCNIYSGTGAPTFVAPANSLYIRTDGSSASTRLYSNTTGSTTWTNFTSAA